MQSLYYSTDHYMRHTGNVVNLEEYRNKLALVQQPASAGLPPLPRRKHRCPLGLRFCDLVSMSMAAMTILLTGAVLAGM